MRKLIIFVAIFAAVAGLVSWKKIQGDHTSLLVNSDVVTEQVLSDSILASGNLIFNTQIQIRSEVTGIVTNVYVEEGQYVEQGQVLMQLDQTAFAADVANYQAAVNAQRIEIEQAVEVNRDFQRRLKLKRKLYLQQLVGEDDVQRLQSQANIARIKVKAANERLNQNLATLAYAQDRLKKTIFKASISGLISAVDVKTGETVIAGTTNIIGSALMTLADPTTILAELRIDEADIASVKQGQSVEVYAAADPKNALAGKVVSIGTSARSSGRGNGLYFRVKALIDSTSRLYPGMSCRAEIITAQSNAALTVPIAAVHQDDGNHYVWLISNNKAIKQEVKVGMASDTHQVITTGVTKDDVVVSGPARIVSTIKNGDDLKIKAS